MLSPHRILFFGLGVACAVSGCAALQKSRHRDPEQSRVELDLAEDSWLREGDRRGALAHALSAVEADPTNAEAAHLLALIYLDFCRVDPDTECRLEEAERHARAALEEKPDFREARNTLGVVLIHRGKHAEAVAVLKPLTEDMLYSTPENAWGNLGWALLELRRVEEAVDALRRSVAAQPMFCVGRHRLALAYELAGDLTAAAETATAALETPAPECSRMQETWAALARIQTARGLVAEATEAVRQCVALDADSPIAQECRATSRELE